MEPNESNESPVFCWRVQTLDARDLDSITALDPDVLNRTGALRAAIRDYAKKLRKRAERRAA